jgi:hypothetical protein
MALFHQLTHGSPIAVGLSFQSLWQLQTSIAHSIEIKIIIILDTIHDEMCHKTPTLSILMVRTWNDVGDERYI